MLSFLAVFWASGCLVEGEGGNWGFLIVRGRWGVVAAVMVGVVVVIVGCGGGGGGGKRKIKRKKLTGVIFGFHINSDIHIIT